MPIRPFRACQSSRFTGLFRPHASVPQFRLARRRRRWPSRRLRRDQQICAAAAASGRRRHSAEGKRRRLSGGDRHARGREHRRSGGAHSGLRAGDQVQGRLDREEGHGAVRDRAGALQGQGRSGGRRRGCRQGPAPEFAGGVRPSGRSGQAPGFDPGQLRQGAGAARHRQGQSRTGPGQYRDRQDQLRLYAGGGAVRRRGDRASRLGRRICRRQQHPDQARHHRADRSDLGEFQYQRTGGAAHSRGARQAGPDIERCLDHPGRDRSADRQRLPVQGPSRLRGADC